MKKLLFIYNPNSGTGKIKNYYSDILNIFESNDYEVEVYATKEHNDGKLKIIEIGDNFDRIVVSGGDGMLHEAINGIMKLTKNIPIGYIPTGTVNDFAKSNNIPSDILEATKISISDNIKTLDIGKFNNEYFSYVAAFGLVTQIAYKTKQSLKNKIGKLAYFLEATKNIDLIHFLDACQKMKIYIDEQEVSDEFIFGTISNSKTIAGMTNFVPDDIKLDDGYFEGLFIRKPKTITELEILKKNLIRNNLNVPELISVKGKKFEIISNNEIEWTLDGEDGGFCNRAEIVVNKKIQIASI